MMSSRSWLLAAVVASSVVAHAAAPGVAEAGTTLTVGPGKAYPTIAAAAAAAAAGDVIEIDAGTYHETVTWQRDGLTVRGVGGRAIVDLTGIAISNGKGIFVSAGANATFERLEFVGAAVPDQNGAGIRWEGGGSLTVRDCVFRSNENGILGGDHADNTALIEFSEFVDNGRGDVGFTHSIYIGAIEALTFRGNWSHALWPDGADIGHLLKSRARHNVITYNRLTSEGGPSSYEINLPQGGEAYVIGNLVQQRVGGQRIMVSFGDGDGTPYPGSKLYVVHNTLVSESTGAATFIRTTQADAQVTVIDNLVVGAGTLVQGGVPTMMGNVTTATPGLVDQAGYDYHLAAGSPAIDVGVDPGMGAAMSLAATSQYKHPRAIESRNPVGTVDVGAYEFGNVPASGDGDPLGGDTTTAASTGCGCQSDGAPSGGLVLAAVVALGMRGRRGRRR